jgi:hypothetical protein
MPFVIAGVSEGSVNTSLESKDLVLSLMVKKSNILMRQKQFRQQQRQNDFSSCFKDQKKLQ